MKTSYIFILIFCAFLVSCSSEDAKSTDNDIVPENYIYLKVDGEKVFSDDNVENLYLGNPVKMDHDVLVFTILHGEVGYVWNEILFYMTNKGQLLQVTQISNGFEFNITYRNYKNFPSNYFKVSDFNFDEVKSKVHFKFEGKLYFENDNFNSESINLSGEIKSDYVTETSTTPNFILLPTEASLLDQNCSAMINGNLWDAKIENPYSTFTSYDAYKFEIIFDINAAAGDFQITPASVTNYVKFSKFNITTLTFDDYIVNGLLKLDYRENHGATKNSFKGTFDFTATNPNDPTDILQVTDGKFTSYKQY